MFRRKRSFRRSGKRPVTRWTGDYNNSQVNRLDTNFNLSDGVIISVTLVSTTDYDISQGLLELKGGTIVRIRGSIDFVFQLNPSADVDVFWNVAMGIIATRETAGIDLLPNPGNVTEFARSDWMWLGHKFGLTKVPNDPMSDQFRMPFNLNHRFDVDVRAKRKLDDMNVILVTAVGTTGMGAEGDAMSFNQSVALRALLKGI